MALELFANFERTSNSNIFYRSVSNVPFSCRLKIQDLDVPFIETELANTFFARYSIDYGQTFSNFDLITGVELFLNRSFVRTHPIDVNLYLLDDSTSLPSPVQTFSLSAAFINQPSKPRVVAYPGLVLDETTGTLTQLTSANYTKSKGVYFYGEGHTEVIYLSSSRNVTWFVGNELNNLTSSVYRVYPTNQSAVSKAIFPTVSRQQTTIPITVCHNDPQIPIVPSAYWYDDITGEKKFYNFITSSLTVSGTEDPTNTKFEESIKIKPYPNIFDVIFFTPFKADVLTLPNNYENETFTAKVSTLAINTAFYTQLTATQWGISTLQDTFSNTGNWSYQTNPLTNIKSYQFPLGYESTYVEFPSILKVSPLNQTILTMEVSCHKLVGLKKPPYDWQLREEIVVFKDAAVFLPRPFIKIHSPNYYNLLDQKSIDNKGREVLGTKFYVDTSNINESYAVSDVTVTGTNFSNTLRLTGEELNNPFYINFQDTGLQTLTATTTLSGTEEITTITNIFPDLVEVLLEFDNIAAGTPYYKSEFTTLSLPTTSSPVLSPNEWAVEDNINNSIKLLYDSVDEIKRSLFRYKKNSTFYGWLGTNKYTWSDLECAAEAAGNTARISWEDNECPLLPNNETYTAVSIDLSARCSNALVVATATPRPTPTPSYPCPTPDQCWCTPPPDPTSTPPATPLPTEQLCPILPTCWCTPPPSPTPTSSAAGTGCGGTCVTPSSNDPSTVEYYGYSSTPAWCSCVGPGFVCNSTLVNTTAGPKLGYYCIPQQDVSCVQCLTQNNGCIYPTANPPCTARTYVASRQFQNPFNYSVQVRITGGVDDDALLKRGSTQLWLRSGSPTTPSCAAGEVDYTFTIGPNETFTIEAYDIYGVCGGVDLCATFDPANCNTPSQTPAATSTPPPPTPDATPNATPGPTPNPTPAPTPTTTAAPCGPCSAYGLTDISYVNSPGSGGPGGVTYKYCPQVINCPDGTTKICYSIMSYSWALPGCIPGQP